MKNHLTPLLTCLLGPIFLSVLRKIVPGQPSYIEVAASLIIVIVLIWLLIGKSIKVPQFVFWILLPWIILQTIYLVFGLLYDGRIVVSAFFTRIVPISMFLIGYTCIKSDQDVLAIAKYFGIFAIGTLPIAIWVILFGNDLLPLVLQPIADLQDLNRDFRAGAPIFAGVFSTGATASLSFLAIFYILLFAISISDKKMERSTFFWFALASSLVAIYASTRRGTLIMALIGLLYFLFFYKKRKRSTYFNLLFWCASVSILFIFIDSNALLTNNEVTGRIDLVTQLDFADRFNNIFLKIFLDWVNMSPMGNYLGFAGPEGRVFGSRVSLNGLVVEVGAAQMVAETGLIGALLLPLLIIILSFYLIYISAQKAMVSAALVLVLYELTFFTLYYTKELSAMSSSSLATIFFWAVPGILVALVKYERPQLKHGILQ